MLWPKIDPEYQAELQGIVEGLRARQVKLDLYDVVALNAFMELGITTCRGSTSRPAHTTTRPLRQTRMKGTAARSLLPEAIRKITRS